MKRTFVVAGLALVAIQAHAQIAPQPSRQVPTRQLPARQMTSPDPAAPQPVAGATLAQQVQRLAPQLVAFAGSQGNFESLVNGMAAGAPVTLTTFDATGASQTVTFTPAASGAASPAQIAQSLELARQQLIASGVAVPNAQQLGSSIAGTVLPVTVAPPVSVAPPPVTVAPPAAPGAAAAGGSLPSAAEQVQARPSVPRVNTSDSPRLGNFSDSPAPANPPAPGPALSAPTPEAAPARAARPGIRADR